MSLNRREFNLGWTPDVDAANAPAEALLRMDNLTLDELGVISVRKGSAKINPGAPLSELDVHSLFTIFRNGVRIRYAGAGNKVFRQATTPLGVTFDGTGDISFSSHLGQVFFARGSAKYKDDGTTVRNWGIAMTGGAPQIVGAVASDTKSFATWDASEGASHTIEEGEVTTPVYEDGFDGAASSSIEGQPLVESNRFVVKRVLPGPTDFTTLSGGGAASDDDIIKMWMYVSNPDVVVKVSLMIDCNGGTFAKDTYLKEWSGAGAAGADGTVANPGVPGVPGPGEIGSGEPPLV